MNTQNTQLKPASTCFSILSSYSSGQGATLPIAPKIDIEGLGVSYLGGTYHISFQNASHKDAMLAMLLYKELASKNVDTLEKWVTHINSGEFLSLNHKDDTKVSIDRYAPFRQLFDHLGIVEIRSNGKGSKLVQLICSPTNETIASLTSAGFANISPLLDGLSIIGLKAELPKIEG